MTRNRILAAAALAALLWGLWYAFPTRTRQVKRRFKAVASWISKDGPEGNLTLAAHAAGAKRFFADPCRFSSESYDMDGSFSTAEMSRYALAARRRFDTLKLKFYDVHVLFPSKDEASVETTARLTGRTTEGTDVAETHEVRCILRKDEEGWLLTDVTLVEVLKK